jgi:FKBP-type peptidyl-prolyl cis-trans isomerase SlyD
MGPMRSGITGLATAALLWAPATGFAQDAAPARVGAGKRVSIVYTVRLEDGTLAASNVGSEPRVYTQGAGEILPGLERALEGLAVGDSRQGTLAAKDAYGEIDAQLFQEVETSRIPEQDRRVGAKLFYREGAGQPRVVRVHEVRGDRITIDMNHPYAGSDVRYDVTVLKIE